MHDQKQNSSNNGKNPAPAKHEIPATRLFKVLNPELFMKPNRLIMYGGVVAMAGIIYWLGSSELEHRQQQEIVENISSQPKRRREQTYQERMADLKRSSA
ncbi:hypothetical protein FB639_001478 [Coemansia asiatica]|nr:hypothetical protein FB639_001478 [Coemansia asiatica]